MKERLYLLDGTLLFFRALYGMPDVFQDDDGRPMNAVRGYVSYLLKLIAEKDVRHCVAAFDESLTTCWRNDLYPDYKANRPEADQNIHHQLSLCRSVTELLKIPLLADLRYEADDFIATLARSSRREVMIVSRDKDLQQLLRENVTILDPADDSVTDVVAFTERFGFLPTLFPDYQALTGDSVDNIPGVRGVGPKSAQRLIGTFGSLEALYAAESDWPTAGVKPASKMAERLRTEREAAFRYRRILRLDDRVPISLKPADMRLRALSFADLRNGLNQLGIAQGLGQANLQSLERYCG